MPRVTRKKPKPPDIDTDEDGQPTADAIRQAVQDLGLNRPFYSCRIVGSRLEFALYGGDLLFWPPEEEKER